MTCQCQVWLVKFHSVDFDVNDAPRSGRPLKADDEEIKAMIKSNPQYTTQEIAETLHIIQSIVHDHLKKLGFHKQA